jgi:hypothetical protein
LFSQPHQAKAELGRRGISIAGLAGRLGYNRAYLDADHLWMAGLAPAGIRSAGLRPLGLPAKWHRHNASLGIEQPHGDPGGTRALPMLPLARCPSVRRRQRGDAR